MKKQTILAGLFLSCFGLFAQPTFVDTLPQNKNVVLEEFTGINCGFCPDAHKIANKIAADNPGRVVLVNIHQGGYANTTPDLRTSFGDPIAREVGVTSSYPVGTVNRHVFTGNKPVLNRDKFESSAKEILKTSSPVNIAAKASLDMTTRELKVTVELYYTDSSAKPTNMLNVVLMQNNILGPQNGMKSNPDQVVGNLYNHIHALRSLLTDQWGVEVNKTEKGSFHTFSFVDTLPLKVVATDLVLEDLEVAAFIAEGKQEILTGCKAEMTYTGVPENYAIITGGKQVDHFECDNKVGGKIYVKNKGSLPVTSIKVKYSGSQDTAYQEFKDLNITKEDTLILNPSVSVVPKKSTTIKVSIVSVNNDETAPASTTSFSVIKHMAQIVNKNLTLKLKQDKFGSETTWTIKNEAGNIIHSGGPYEDLAQNGEELHTISVPIPSTGCYLFEMIDKDGINNGFGKGGYEFVDNAGTVLISRDGKFVDKDVTILNAGVLSIATDPVLNAVVDLSPNPSYANTNLSINLTQNEKINVLIYDALGRLVWEQGAKNMNVGKTEINLPTAAMKNGIYSVIIRGTNSQISRKLVIR